MNIIRNEQGVMLMKVAPVVVNDMLKNLKGRVTIKNFEGGESKRCFVLDKHQTIDDGMSIIYLWKGSYIEL